MRLLFAILLLLLFANVSIAQSGMYRFTHKTGASCTVAITKKGNQISADIFSWWHIPSGRNGSFSGEGQLNGNECVLSDPDDKDCKVRLKFKPGRLNIIFDDCVDSNLPGDFSGSYRKLTDHLPGDYKVTMAKAYFYRSPGAKPLHAYLIKGNKVMVDLENIVNERWVFINFADHSGKITSGYMTWKALE